MSHGCHDCGSPNSCECDRLRVASLIAASERAHKEAKDTIKERAATKVRDTLAKAAAGAHYKKGKFEVWEVIEELQKTWPPEVRYHVGSALKYLGRLGAKEGASVTDDIEKAITFLTRALAVLKGIEMK